MSIVAVAGGQGDLGRLIVDALLKTGKHEVYILSRRASPTFTPFISPHTNRPYSPYLQTSYTSPGEIATLLSTHKITTIISTLIMDSPAASASQINLIRAADVCPTVKRFLPSEFNVDYSQPDSILPYPEKKFHIEAREELSKTKSLEYMFVYTGMFMDYFFMPKLHTVLRPLYFFVDVQAGMAILPGDGEGKMSMTWTEDAARLVAWSLDLEEEGQWGRGKVMITAVETITLNELVAMVEKHSGKRLQVQYQPVEELLRRNPVEDLPGNVQISKDFPQRFPGGLEQVRALVADLEASVALGAYDFGRLEEGGYVDLVKLFEGREPKPRGLGDLLEEAWR